MSSAFILLLPTGTHMGRLQGNESVHLNIRERGWLAVCVCVCVYLRAPWFLFIYKNGFFITEGLVYTRVYEACVTFHWDGKKNQMCVFYLASITRGLLLIYSLPLQEALVCDLKDIEPQELCLR